jgi:outer membrane receptor protein involved in Fe transport
MSHALSHPFKLVTLSILGWALVAAPPALPAQEQVKAKDKSRTVEKAGTEKDQEKPVRITEEIQVIGKVPEDIPLATVTTVTYAEIQQLKPRDLSDILKFVPGALVTFGDKDTFTLKLRGLDAKRIALLVDGIPVYEPYFSTFDLKTISAGGIETVQVTKGPSSVLYGPNTLGGIVNVITRRPGQNPYLSLAGSYGDTGTKEVGLDTSFRLDRFAFAADALYQDSNGFYFPSPEGGRTLRSNSDYSRLNLNGKAYYSPSDGTEIMVEAGLYQSDYGMPAALFTQRARYWRFPKWDRTTLNAGGFASLGGDAVLRFRTYWVNYVNTLDWYSDPAMTTLQSESTYDNSVYGGFALAEVPTGNANTLKASLLFQRDIARIQDDVGLPWDEFRQGTLSGGVEDELRIAEKWAVIGGLSLDVIHKFEGGRNNTSLNPLIGLKYTPGPGLDFHASFARKSRFPSMRSLYSLSSGNPDLLSESGTSLEISAAYAGDVFLTGTVFFNSFRNFIDTVQLPDGTRRYFNVGRARIYGFELQAQKSLPWLSSTVNYTFLEPRNVTDERPLDAQPRHNLNFEASLFPLQRLRVGLYGLLGSTSWWYNFGTSELLSIPAYFNLDAVLSWRVRPGYEAFLKLGNVFNHYFYTEPGFPWRGRFLEFGVRLDVLR